MIAHYHPSAPGWIVATALVVMGVLWVAGKVYPR